MYNVCMALCICILCICVSVCLCICVSVYLCICVSVYLCICVSVYLCICVPVYLCICVTVYLCICVSVYLWICVFVFLQHHSCSLKWNLFDGTLQSDLISIRVKFLHGTVYLCICGTTFVVPWNTISLTDTPVRPDFHPCVHQNQKSDVIKPWYIEKIAQKCKTIVIRLLYKVQTRTKWNLALTRHYHWGGTHGN